MKTSHSSTSKLRLTLTRHNCTLGCAGNDDLLPGVLLGCLEECSPACLRQNGTVPAAELSSFRVRVRVRGLQSSASIQPRTSPDEFAA